MRLLQSRADPPLEIVWFYAAVTFHGTDVSSENDPLSRISSAKDLFQHLSACSASSNGVKSIALLAPVLFKLHHSVVEFFSSVDKSLLEKNSKKSKKLVREIECLVEGILGYVSICNSSSRSYGEFGFSADLLPCFSELIRVWVVDRLEGQWDVREGLRVFFPLVDDEIRNVFWEGECGVGYLAGVVIVEAFLLRLCWKVRLGAAKSELERELRAWVVGSITGFCNRIFFEMLLRLLLEPSLPVSSLLSSEEESFLRKVMYDAVILVDYSFLNPISADELNDDHMKSLAMMWLISVHEAVQVARVNGDQNKAISYINAFSRSQLCSELIKWVAGQIGMEKSNIPTASTPQALLKWLLNLEDRGLKVFANGISMFRTRLVFDDSNMNYEHEHPIFKPDKTTPDDNLFFIDNKGEVTENGMEEDQEMQSMDASFIAAAHTMRFTANDGRRKRKERKEGEKQVKFIKYKLHNSSAKENVALSSVDGTDSGSEVENIPSDHDMEEMEQ